MIQNQLFCNRYLAVTLAALFTLWGTGGLNAQTYSATTPTSGKNYVRSTQVLAGGITTDAQLGTTDIKYLQQQVTYFDGLGRPQQQVTVSTSPTKKDLVTPVYYDALGRNTRNYLPYTISNIPGAFRPSALLTEQQAFYTSTQGFAVVDAVRAFGETVLEPSPLNRVAAQALPGNNYQPGSGHTVNTAYEANVANQVWLLSVVNTNDVKVAGYYAAGKLFLTRTIDPDGRTAEEFKDFDGNVVLSRVKNGGVYVSTYYAYDDLNRLRWVLTPTASNQLALNKTIAFATDTLGKHHAYAYRYNGFGRIIEKRLPGAEPVYLVYDKADQVVASQDGVQRTGKQWLITRYDALGRPLATAVWTAASALTPEQLQTQYDASWKSWSQIPMPSGGYPLPLYNVNLDCFGALAANNVLQQWMYDSYYQTPLASGILKKQPVAGVLDTTLIRTDLVRGRLTAQVARVVDPATQVVSQYTTVFYYDEYGRVVQSVAQNHLGGVEVNATKYLYPHAELPELVYEAHQYKKAPGDAAFTTLATTTRYI